MTLAAIATIIGAGASVYAMSQGGDDEDATTIKAENLTPNQSRLLNDLVNQQMQLLGLPGETYPGDYVPGPGALTRQAQSQAYAQSGRAGEALGDFGQLSGEQLQQGSQPYLDALMSMFKGQVAPGIAGQFGAMDSARSSGLGQAIGQQASGLPGQAMNQFLGQRQFDQNAALQSLGFGAQMGTGQDILNQAIRSGDIAKYMGQQVGGDPRLNNLGLALGTDAFDTIYNPGTTSASNLATLGPTLGTLFQNMGSLGQTPSTAGGGYSAPSNSNVNPYLQAYY